MGSWSLRNCFVEESPACHCWPQLASSPGLNKTMGSAFLMEGRNPKFLFPCQRRGEYISVATALKNGKEGWSNMSSREQNLHHDGVYSCFFTIASCPHLAVVLLCPLHIMQCQLQQLWSVAGLVKQLAEIIKPCSLLYIWLKQYSVFCFLPLALNCLTRMVCNMPGLQLREPLICGILWGIQGISWALQT